MSKIRRSCAAPRFWLCWLALASFACKRGDSASQPEPTAPKVERARLVILGFDGVDPSWMEDYASKGKLPNIERLRAAMSGRGYRHLRSTNPPQSPVAWTSFATGTEPGDHGIFDFIARSLPQVPGLVVVPKVATTTFEGQVNGPPVARNLRSGEPFWQRLGNDGVRVVALNVPYSFPPDPMRDGKLLSGLGTPDLRETNSTFTYAATDATQEQIDHPPGGGVFTRIEVDADKGRFELEGPSIPGGKGERMRVSIAVDLGGAVDSTQLAVGEQRIKLELGKMSDFVEVELAHEARKVKGLARFVLLEAGVRTRIFVTPISMHPRAPYSPFTYPKAFAAELDDAVGHYKSVGWDHDTSALNAEVIDDALFLAEMAQIETQRRKMLHRTLERDDWDLLIWVSTATDRVAHMFYRLIDKQHPRYDAALAERHGRAIEDEYARMDETIGQVLGSLRPSDTLLILSDHGFHGYRRGLHVNQWLRQQGLLTLRSGATSSQREFLVDVDWSKTKAYALGTGQIYFNRAGREREGIVREEEVGALGAQIRQGLLALTDAERGGVKVVSQVYVGTEVFRGGRASDAPDLQVAFAEHYRTSWESILGGVPDGLFADNDKKWSGDHAASDVAETDGILLANRPIVAARPAIVDLAPTALRFFGKPVPSQMTGHSVLAAEGKP